MLDYDSEETLAVLSNHLSILPSDSPKARSCAAADCFNRSSDAIQTNNTIEDHNKKQSPVSTGLRSIYLLTSPASHPFSLILLLVLLIQHRVFAGKIDLAALNERLLDVTHDLQWIGGGHDERCILADFE